VEQIASVVRRAAEAESIEIPPPAVAALARSATGSFRDALGTLEQLVTYSGNRVALEDVLAVLGVADSRLLEETVDAVNEGDGKRALRALGECVEQGREAASFAADLEVRARELLVVQTLGEVPAELALTPESDEALARQAERVEHTTVVRLLELLGEAMEGVRAGADGRTRLELALVKAARPALDGSMRALLARIERLEGGGSAGGGGRAAAVAVPRPPVTAPNASVTPAISRPASEEVKAVPATSDPAPEPLAAAVSAPEPVPVSSEGPPALAADLEAICALWPAVVDLVRGENALIAAVIGEARPVAVNGEDLTLAFAAGDQFLKKKAEDPANRVTVAEALKSLSGGRWRVSYELREDLGVEDRPEAGGRSEEDWIRRFVEEFDAEEIAGDGSLGTDQEPTPEGSAPNEEHGGQAVTSNQKGA
jgi:DNA polymerase-3 subunit gamma/tau